MLINNPLDLQLCTSVFFLGGGVGGGCLFEAGCLLTFPTYMVGIYSRWALIRGWALNRINTVCHSIVDNNNYSTVLFFSSVKGQGTEEQKAKWLPLAESYQIIGTYAQTELGHGKYIALFFTPRQPPPPPLAGSQSCSAHPKFAFQKHASVEYKMHRAKYVYTDVNHAVDLSSLQASC